MTLETLVLAGKWHKYFLTDKKEKLPFTEENNQEYISKNLKWSLIYEQNPFHINNQTG